MKSIDFWNDVGVHCVCDFNQNPHAIKNIAIAVWAIDATFSHLYWEKNPEGGQHDESKFKYQIAKTIPSLNIILEASNSLKHAVRSNDQSLSVGSDAIQNRERGWGEAEFGVDVFDGGPIPLLEFRNGSSASLKHAVEEAVEWIGAKFKK